MTQYKEEFLLLIRTAMGTAQRDSAARDEITWEEIFRLAEQHHVLPMVVDAAYHIYGNNSSWNHRFMFYKKRAQRLIYLQTVKTERFLSLYKFLSGQSLTPLVMKGLVCRDLYPNPEFRFSADEDLLIPPDEVSVYHEALLAYGLKTDSSEQSTVSAQEISYKSDDGVLFLEVHRFPFPPDSIAYGEYNSYFEDVFSRAVIKTYDGVDVWTMAPTDHLFYLICHVIKHFLHGGCGIRQVCDIGLFAREYGNQINWVRLINQIVAIHAQDFTTALFSIIEKSLGIELKEIPDSFRLKRTNFGVILDDILDSGIYGSSTMSRKHSATITLRMAETFKYGRSGDKRYRTRTLFPPVSSMAKRYPYLVKRPWLLPLAWLQRISSYMKSCDADNTPSQALRVGRKRVAILKQYGLLSDTPVKRVDTDQYLSALCELIDQGHEVSIPVVGSSMTPFLGDGRDQIFVKAPCRQILRGDIVLYRRSSGDFILHRVHHVHGKGNTATYDMIGDAQNRIEHRVHVDQIFAVATRARRKGKIIEPGSFYWWFFQHVWIRIIPLRRILIWLYAVINK